MFIYIVKNKDTLYEISKRFGVDINKIADDNQINPNDSLVIGQALVIRKDNFIYTVKEGDSLYKISNEVFLNAADIMIDNNLTADSVLNIGDKLTINYDNPNKIPLEINGYVYANVNLEELKNVLPNLTYLAIFSYQIKEDGSLSNLNEEPIIKEAYRYQVAPLMVITNIDKPGVFSSELASKILNSDELSNKLINNIISVMKKKGYYGADFDFEYLYPKDKEAYNRFLEKAKTALHKEGFIISSAIAPKLNADQTGLLYEAHDYEAHGRILDHVIIMTYEWGYLHSEAMSVSPINMVEKVIEYAVSVIPSEKILMGVPNYGYVFDVPKKENVPAKLITNNEAIDIARKHNAQILFDDVTKTPYFDYYENGNHKQVHFDDARSYEEKINLAIDFELGGLSYWTVMNYFKPNWLVVDFFVDIIKVIKQDNIEERL